MSSTRFLKLLSTTGVAAKMIALGMDTATICAATGLTEQQVDNMRS